MKLGEIIRFYRATHCMSMDDFAKVSGISKSYISLLEKDKHPKTGEPITPSVSIINQAANGMGISFDTLFKMLNSDQAIYIKDSIDRAFLASEADGSHSSEDAVLQYFNNLSPTREELDLIKNYRQLDSERKAIVDFVLKMSV